MTKLSTLGILFSTAVRAVIVPVSNNKFFLTLFNLELRSKLVSKLLIIHILPLTLFISALRVVLLATLIISDILILIFLS